MFTPRQEGSTGRPPLIRYDEDTWLVMRNNREFPKGIIRRVRDRVGTERCQLCKWDIAPARRLLMGTYPTLVDADAKVLFGIDPRTGQRVNNVDQLATTELRRPTRMRRLVFQTRDSRDLWREI